MDVGKHAVIITAYKDKQQLKNLVEKFDGRFNIYIHVDTKSKIVCSEFSKLKNVRLVLKTYKIGWGSIYHILAIIDLLKVAIRDKNNYIHIISGQDYLSRGVDELFNFFEGNDRIYMTVMDSKTMPESVINRYRKGCLSSKFDQKKYVTRFLNALYGLFSARKEGIGPFTRIYKGLVWCSMPRVAANYVIDFFDTHPSFMRDLAHCIVPEEFFFQTILMNSKFKEKIIDNDLRYNDWSYRNGSMPAYLDENDFEKIVSEHDFFCRKIDSFISGKLISKLDKHIHDRR